MPLEWRKYIKELHKQINDDLNNKLTTITREQDDKIKTVNNMSQVNTSKIREIETWTVVIENKIEETTKDRSGEVSHMKEEIQEEMNKIRGELRRRQNQMMVFPTQMEERSRIKFAGGKWENSMEFLARMDKEIEEIGSAINDDVKIDFATRHHQDSPSQWCSIIRDNITTCQQFRDAFENRYWNIHTQRQVHDQLEYGKFNVDGHQSIEQYTIAQIECVKHLKPKFAEHEIVSKLSYHFQRDIQLAVYTQGIKP